MEKGNSEEEEKTADDPQDSLKGSIKYMNNILLYEYWSKN